MPSDSSLHNLSTQNTDSSSPGTAVKQEWQRLLQYRWFSNRWRWVILGGLLLCGAIAPVSFLLQTASQPEEDSDVLPVSVTTAEAVTEYEQARLYAGEVVARRKSDLSFEQAGTVLQILVDEGDRVVAGQPLAQLDTRSIEAEMNQLMAQRDRALAQLQELQAGPRAEDIAAAQAAVDNLDAQVSLAALQESRRQDLYAEGAISREALDQQSFGLSALESQRQQAQSQLDELLAGTRSEQVAAQGAQVRQLDASIDAIAIQASKSTIVAPFSGEISQRWMDEGAIASGGQPVLTLVETGTLEVRVGVPIGEANSITVGSQQTLQIGEEPYLARVTALLPEVESTSRTVTVVLQLQNNAGITVGQTAYLELVQRQAEEGIWLPATALVPDREGLWAVFVAEPQTNNERQDNSQTNNSSADTIDESMDYRAVKRSVEIIHMEGDRLLVRGTLQPGEFVITGGTHRIVSDQKIQVIP